MILQATPRLWTKSRQYGLRFRNSCVQTLGPLLPLPCRHGRFKDVWEFLREAQAGRQPSAYSRPVHVTSLQDNEILQRYLTLSYLGSYGTQGNITAPNGTWFADWVKKRLDQPVRIDYQVLPACDLAVLL